MRRLRLPAPALALLGVVALGCASGGGEALRRPDVPAGFPLVSALQTYREMGFVVGDEEFPLVGRFLYLRGPGDSTLVGFAASFPTTALRFAREGDQFAASYQVRLRFLRGGDTVRRVDRQEAVRVNTFAETGRTDESVVFQHFTALPPGEYTSLLIVRELSSRREVERQVRLEVPSFGPGGRTLSTPQVAYRVEPRSDRGLPPKSIFSPRATVTYDHASGFVIVEDYSGEPGGFDLRVEEDGRPIWAETLGWMVGGGNAPASGSVRLPLDRLPPGSYTIRVRSLATGQTAEAPLLVSPAYEWVFAREDSALSYLDYAMDPETLRAMRGEDAERREQAWRRFWDETDTVPSSTENEYLDGYFERMQAANERFAEADVPGWRTDRGHAYVVLGPPDRELTHPPDRSGGAPQLEWVYVRGSPVQARLFFESEDSFGAYRLTPHSRQLLATLAGELRERLRQRSGAALDRGRSGGERPATGDSRRAVGP